MVRSRNDLVITILAALFFVSGYAHASYPVGNAANYSVENSHCEVPYAVSGWKMAFCMTLYESYDSGDYEVQKCLNDAIEINSLGDDVCNITKFWKTKWCQVSSDRGYVQSAESCLANPNLFPTSLEHGL